MLIGVRSVIVGAQKNIKTYPSKLYEDTNFVKFWGQFVFRNRLFFNSFTLNVPNTLNINSDDEIIFNVWVPRQTKSKDNFGKDVYFNDVWLLDYSLDGGQTFINEFQFKKIPQEPKQQEQEIPSRPKPTTSLDDMTDDEREVWLSNHFKG